jgi:AcrR family transcriptional regulator
MMPSRKYELKKRAERQEETRQRIVEATVHLHETIGGQAATVSAIAQQAGVERLTVYRHFPDERSLVCACTSHYFAQNLPPNPERWLALVDPEDCLRTGLTEIYAYHRQTDAMMNSIHRDLAFVPLLQELLQPLFANWDSVADKLANRFPVDEGNYPSVRAAVGLAIDFLTWRTLVRVQGLDDAQAIDLMVSTVVCLTQRGDSNSRSD